jgi:hypothetical protein
MFTSQKKSRGDKRELERQQQLRTELERQQQLRASTVSTVSTAEQKRARETAAA